MNKQRKVYYNGAYYDALSKDVEVLKQQAPNLYAVLFPRTEYKMRDEKIQVYQIYYDKNSFENLDAGFIPYQTKSTPHNFENDVILDIWRKRDWVKAKYVGVLSWRFYEKTLLSSKDIKYMADPEVFDDYCTNYLSKAIEFFKGTDLYDRTEKHRGKQYLSMTFFLEGLFSVYLTEKNL